MFIQRIVVLLCAVVFSGGAARADILTLQFSGTIGRSFDNNNLFGQGPVLDGLPFVLSVSVNSEGMDLAQPEPGIYTLSNWHGNLRSWGEVTVAGHTYRWLTRQGSGQVNLTNTLSLYGGANDSMFIGAGGPNLFDGQVASAGGVVNSDRLPFLSTLSPFQDLDLTPLLRAPGVTSFADFVMDAPDGTRTYFGAASPLLTATWQALPVPAPAPVRLMLGGLLLLASLRVARHGRARRV